MSKKRNIILILLIIVVIFLIRMAIINSIVSLFPPSKASDSDILFEDIGGDNFLNATLRGCLKVKEENIPDGTFEASSGNWSWYDAKNITYVGTTGLKDYLIVWKTTPDKYDFEKKGINIYVSDYLIDRDAKCFIEYSYENDCVYGIVVGTENLHCSEPHLMYDILGLNRSGFALSYSYVMPSSSGNYHSTGSSYHTVIPDRYTLSRTDPGAYYDHYEYGDDYDIDDYLEVEGYD